MKAANMSMGVHAWRVPLTLVAIGLVLYGGSVVANPPAGKPPSKASSFAPHPTHRRVFGAPIQAPIVRHVTPKKEKSAPK